MEYFRLTVLFAFFYHHICKKEERKHVVSYEITCFKMPLVQMIGHFSNLFLNDLALINVYSPNLANNRSTF